ncbi:MAG: VanW family protein [Selenomonadaceae bacterium]|nr:VanW family protein [Selenomonadaceae bacterium]
MEVLNVENFSWKSLFSLKGISIISLAAVAVAGAGTLAVSSSIAASNKIVDGVRFEGREIAGLTAPAAEKFFKKEAGKRIHALTFSYEGREFEIKPEDISLNANVDKAVSDAESYGRGDGVFKNLINQIKCSMGGREVKLTAAYNEESFKQKLDEIAAQINTEPANAFVNFYEDGTIERIPGVIGKKLDTEKIAESLKENLVALNLPSGKIELHPEETLPFITTEDIANIDSVIGSYSTSYYPGSRGDNIWLAANSLSNKIVKPGWTFSFNDTVGERTYAAGYQNAGVIVNGQADVGVGGGVCQVSSTLYNAVLLAGLTPTERTPHYFKSAYIGAGRDATVADGLIDFKFRNDLPHSVCLKAYASGSTLSIFVLGTRADLNGANISIEREGSDMAPSIYRVYTKDGQVIKDEFLHTDTYHTAKS